MMLNWTPIFVPFHVFCIAGMAELAGLVQRLEVAVSRLESMSAGGGGDSAGGGNDGFVMSRDFFKRWHFKDLLDITCDSHRSQYGPETGRDWLWDWCTYRCCFVHINVGKTWRAPFSSFYCCLNSLILHSILLHKLVNAFFYGLVVFCSPAVSAYVEAFDEIVNGPLAEYISLSQKIGGDVQTHVSYSSRAKQYIMCLPSTAASIIPSSFILLPSVTQLNSYISLCRYFYLSHI